MEQCNQMPVIEQIYEMIDIQQTTETDMPWQIMMLLQAFQNAFLQIDTLRIFFDPKSNDLLLTIEFEEYIPLYQQLIILIEYFCVVDKVIG